MRKEGEKQEALRVAEWAPLVDITEDDKEYTIKAELPDIKKDDVKISVRPVIPLAALECPSQGFVQSSQALQMIG